MGTGRRARVLRAMLVGLLVSVSVTALSRTGVLAGWETRAVDAFLFLRDRVAAPEITWAISTPAPASPTSPPNPSTKPSSS